MPFETFAQAPRRIAIVGGGIAGMAAAHQLAPDNGVVLFEAETRLGGHARTVIAGKRGDQPVDTGFIVFNKVNYPHLLKMFEALDVPIAPSNMSFGASIGGGRLQYALRDLDGLFAQRRNLLNPSFLRMCRDITHFNKHAAALADSPDHPDLTIGDLLAMLRTGPYFRDYYILPLSGAIWSTPPQDIMAFPAQALIRFFQNHALMQISNQHQWFTVKGGSTAYVSRLQADLLRHGVEIRLGSAIAGIQRVADGVMVRAEGGEWELFDDLILATHSDDSLRLLSDASEAETAALSAVRYQPNDAILHADASVMPALRKCWSSWVYTEPQGARPDKIDLTYWMNSLQPIPQDDPLFVTLNANQPIRQELIYDQVTFRHPVYDGAALRAQKVIKAMNGQRNTWFCGAWMRNGFHEDGFASAVDVVDAMRQRVPAG
ncbi:cyclopropane-fatty-acyl-phospholipid synthase [Cypionkella aquatica]|uniref:Cyclopropane-fatty-acyl-phospholipid synthase n=1 Tax=Cypionkella aquatica TaxID=1756042 RepID=A0AA37TZQ8_9RHOB|nr:FAD-dependent oxidoreductase [Cypionkella aquatica]GLS85861.1 cyclopropane-fatty-acyl-phospholipid synthase [Cypionkella aquatica]